VHIVNLSVSRDYLLLFTLSLGISASLLATKWLLLVLITFLFSPLSLKAPGLIPSSTVQRGKTARREAKSKTVTERGNPRVRAGYYSWSSCTTSLEPETCLAKLWVLLLRWLIPSVSSVYVHLSELETEIVIEEPLIWRIMAFVLGSI
jgi:hypothetical protein